MGLSCLDDEDETLGLAVFPLHPGMSSSLEGHEHSQVLGETGLLIQGRKQLDVALKGHLPKDARFLTDYSIHGYSGTVPPCTGFLLLKVLQVEAHQAGQTTAFKASYHTRPPLALAGQQSSIAQHTSWAATASLLKESRETSNRTKCHRTKTHVGMVMSPLARLQNTETRSCVFPSLPTQRVIIMPLITRHPQPPEPLHPCCVQVYSTGMLSNAAKSSSSDHHVKTRFAKKLLLANPLLTPSCIILA